MDDTATEAAPRPATGARRATTAVGNARVRFTAFRNWPILRKIVTISIISISVINSTIYFYFLPLVEQRVLEAKKQGTKHVVEIAHAVLVEYERLGQSGRLSQPEAQRLAIQAVKSFRYEEGEYLWLNDLTPTMVMHPTKPELDGQSLVDFKDPKGKLLFREFVRVCADKGAGYVDYMWPKPGESTPVPKVSYVKLFKPWGFIVGSGVYMDDVQADLERIRRVTFFGTVLFAALTLSVAFVIGAGITRPLRKVIDGLRSISSGGGDVDLTHRIPVHSNDEIGLLSGEFNALMESIRDVSSFKKVIEEDDALEDVYLRLARVFGALGLDRTVIYEVGRDGAQMRPVVPLVYPEDEALCAPEILARCSLCKAKKTGHSISSLTYPSICKQFRGGEGAAHHCVPVVIGGGTVGVVEFVVDAPKDAAESAVVKRRLVKAEQYIEESLSVIETKRLMDTLRDSALTDALTGLRNRRFLQEYVENLVAGILRRKKQIGLIMGDLDFFKQVNDAHGHAAGDAVLRETARILTKSVRAADLVIRFGGEEFLVVLMDTEPESALVVAEKIRKALESHTFRLADGTLKKTISLGVAEFPGDAETLWQAIKFADVALYAAKAAGRNQSARFSPEMWKEQQF